jgi:hypothetical protein
MYLALIATVPAPFSLDWGIDCVGVLPAVLDEGVLVGVDGVVFWLAVEDSSVVLEGPRRENEVLEAGIDVDVVIDERVEWVVDKW